MNLTVNMFLKTIILSDNTNTYILLNKMKLTVNILFKTMILDDNDNIIHTNY